jgi:RNA polymerase-binding transcription factor DksA
MEGGQAVSDIEHELIATQWDLKVAKDRIELLMSANADVARIAAERDAAEKRVMHLEAALRKIADQDYRGPRSTESEIALRALEAKP